MPLRLLAIAFLLIPALDARVTVRFSPADPDVGPYPSDALTVADASQKTGLRVNLPLPDCRVQASACAEVQMINTLDGFSIIPRIRVRFDGPVNIHTLREGVFFVTLDNLTSEEHGLQERGQFLPINEVLWDPQTNTAFAKPDYFLDQHRRYGLIVTDAVRDRDGAGVEASPEFQACAAAARRPADYCEEIRRLVEEQQPRFGSRRIVAASLFTTMSVTAWLESARQSLESGPPPALSVSHSLRPAELRSAVFQQQVDLAPGSPFIDLDLTAALPLLAAVNRLVFGTYRSPDFTPGELVIPPWPTGAAVPPAAASSTIGFHVFVPATPKPAAGYPVVIGGHGFSDSRFGGPSAMAAPLATAGIATVAINAFGHGGGPASKVVATSRDGTVTEIETAGRGVDLNRDGRVAVGEGCLAPVIGYRDCIRQTVVDLMQLVRAIRRGADLDGDGSNDLDPNRIYFFGQSLGANYGTVLAAVEPLIRAATLNVGGGTLADIMRLSPGFHEAARLLMFASRTPPLLNEGADFNSDGVLRYQPAKTITVPQAVQVQEVLERLEWISLPGEPVGFAPHLKSSTLPGVPIKPVLFQFARGDLTVPNPANTALIRAANLRESSWMYRHDLARAAIPELPRDPHSYLATFFLVPNSQALAIALGSHAQAGAFFASDGQIIVDPNTPLGLPSGGPRLFEVPDFLPETPNF